MSRKISGAAGRINENVILSITILSYTLLGVKLYEVIVNYNLF